MPVPEIFLSAFVSILFHKLTSGQIWNFARRVGIHTKIKKWEQLLLLILSMTSDAEERQTTSQAVRVWLDNLQDMAYEMDDILDEFVTEELKRKLDGLNPLQTSTNSTVKACLPSCCTSGGFSRSAFSFSSQMRSKIDGINSRLESISKHGRDLNLESISKADHNRATVLRNPTTSLIHEPPFCGRDSEKKDIIEFLLSDDNRIGVIPILGMGGLGKTTLAQAVYNDEKVTKHFDSKSWVCVSEEFDIMRITKSILESVTFKSCDVNSLDEVQVELKKSLAGKKFLIILDDVWNKNYNDWNILRSPFSEGAQGSKVVVTTRDADVASMVTTVKHHTLELLPFKDCWLVFSQHAFGNRSMEENPNLVAIGKKLVEKCKGLPMAARTLGVLLQCKESEDEWEDVLNSRIWWEEIGILAALRLSYQHLPSHLKLCFAYCSIFPKGYKFTEKELVLLWMAEGFVQQGNDGKQLEDIGRSYFHELLSRSFFQPSDAKGGLKSFLMHDLINDLAQLVSRDLSFGMDDKLEAKYKNLGRARHSSVLQEPFARIENFKSFFEAKNVRTFIPISLSAKECYLAANVPSILFPKLRGLRTLSLRMYRNVELAASIGDMKHLRYLDLSFTDIKELPDWVQELYNLQTLILRECVLLNKLPKNMGNLVQLRHFDVTNTYNLREMPLGIGNMENLQMLSDFIVTKDNGSQIKELGKLKHIGETLRLSGLQNVTDHMDAKGACLIKKENLDGLRFEFGEFSEEIPKEEVERKVLDKLQPHNKLKELHICWYHGTRFPSWLENPLFPNMVHIEIKHCKHCDILPPLGQLNSLKELHIIGMSGVKHVGREFYGLAVSKPFPVLEVLRFEDMPEWEDWFSFKVDDEVRSFDQVTRLLIINCPKLVGKLPSNLPRLEILEIRKCQKLVVEFEGLVYPAITFHSVDGELPLSSSMLNKMNNTHPSSCLSTLRLENVSIPDSLWSTSIFCQHLNSVTKLTFENIRNLVRIPKWLAFNLTALKQLDVRSCVELETLLDNRNYKAMPLELQQQLPALQNLHIELCPQLVSLFFEGEGAEMDREIKGNNEKEAVQCFMLKLESLTITGCAKLDKLPRGLYMLTCLVQLSVSCCDNLISLPEAGFPSTLKTLHINICKALESPLPCWNNNNNLESVHVFSCSSLTSLFSSSCCGSIITGGVPSSLKRLEIGGCEKLETLVSWEEMKIHCPSLEVIYISNCGRLKYLPDTHDSNSLRNFKDLWLTGCKVLQGFSDRWLRAITNLRNISIGEWTEGGEMTVFSCILKEASFLINLTYLRLYNLTTNVHPSEWGLHRLSYLTTLTLAGLIRDQEGVVVKVIVFPLHGMLLPTSLTTLRIKDFPDLERLSSKGFEYLSSLEHLSIFRCPRLAYLPEGGFPDTLLTLHMKGCPLLEKKCEKGKGRYWSFISSIPHVYYT